jgi:hypothetical protein
MTLLVSPLRCSYPRSWSDLGLTRHKDPLHRGQRPAMAGGRHGISPTGLLYEVAGFWPISGRSDQSVVTVGTVLCVTLSKGKSETGHKSRRHVEPNTERVGQAVLDHRKQGVEPGYSSPASSGISLVLK